MEDRRGSVRRADHPVPGGEWFDRSGLDDSQCQSRRRRTDWQHHPHAGQDPNRRRRDQGRRPGRGGQAERNADGRHAGPERNLVAIPAVPVHRAGTGLCHRTEEPRRRGEDQHRPPAAAGRGPDHPLHPRRPDRAAAALRTGTVAHRGHRRQAQAPLRGRGESQAAENPVSRDHQGGYRGARTSQEADRRTWPVRGLQDQGGAAAARRGLSVRRRDLRGRDPARVHPRRRKGHPGGADTRLSGRLPDGGLSGHPLRRIVPPGRFERNVLQDGGPARVPRRHVACETHAARARHERRGVRAQRLRRRPDG